MAVGIFFSTPVVAEKDSTVSPVYVIPIEGPIEPALLYVIRRGISEAEQARAQAIIFTMETPGGRVKEAEEIIRLIDSIELPAYTLVDKNAISAGAIISLATDAIYMTPGSKIGDAMPIMMSPLGGAQEMPEGVEEKMVSYVASLVRATAQNNGYNDELAEAMVRRELEFKIGDEIICPAGQLLTLTHEEAARPYGENQQPLLSSGTVKDLDELIKLLQMEKAPIVRLEVTGAEKAARFIAMLSPFLLMAGLLGIYIEVKTPGFGLPGLGGLLCLAVFFWGHHVAGLAGSEELLIFAAGVILLAIELFVIPGFGITGVAGILLMMVGLLLAMAQQYPNGPVLPTMPQLQVPFMNLGIALTGTIIGALILGRLLPKSSIFSRLILQTATARDKGFDAGPSMTSWVGTEGVAITDLKPSGTGRFADSRLDVISRGQYITRGSTIRAIEAKGNHLVVEATGG